MVNMDAAGNSPKKPKFDDGDDVPTGQDDPCSDLLEVRVAQESTKRVALSEELLEKEDYDGAVQVADSVLGGVPSLPTIALAALVRGRAIINKAMEKMAESGEEVPQEVYERAWNAFGLSSRLNPECQETVEEMEKLSSFLRDRPMESAPEDADANFDVIVVGAGCSGVGTALMLTKTFGLPASRVLLVERGEGVGETFRRWPKEMRFISPSFNQQGWTDSFDLNSISHGSSPAFSLHSEHPSGNEYATYLAAIAKTNELNVRLNTEVEWVECIRPVKEGDEGLPLFSVDVRSKGHEGGEAIEETIFAHAIVWAAGEFQYPKGQSKPAKNYDSMFTEEKKADEQDESERIADFPGSQYCFHNSTVDSWSTVEGDEFIVIGGYESGADACYNLARTGRQCRVLASTPCWDIKTADPSIELAPYTAARLREVTAPDFAPRPRLYAPLRVVKVEKAEGGGFDVTAEWQEVEEIEDAPLREPNKIDLDQEPGEPGSIIVLHTANPPVLATGFEGSVRAAASHLFDFPGDEHPRKGCLGNAPLLSEDDESTKVPGVFLVGPQVQHDSLSFCFVYKFRQRFAVVADAICRGLGMDTKAAVAECRNHNMYLDDFETCEDTCGDVC